MPCPPVKWFQQPVDGLPPISLKCTLRLLHEDPTVQVLLRLWCRRKGGMQRDTELNVGARIGYTNPKRKRGFGQPDRR